jgi:hypothetical protein
MLGNLVAVERTAGQAAEEIEADPRGAKAHSPFAMVCGMTEVMP